MAVIPSPKLTEEDSFAMTRDERQSHGDFRHSKFNKLKSHFEKNLIRPTNMDIHQLRRPSQLFKSSIRDHRRRSSLEDTINMNKNLQMSPVKFDSSIEQQDINAVPQIQTIPNFHSQTNSILCTDSDYAGSDSEHDFLSSPGKSDLSPTNVSTPKISITLDSSSVNYGETETLSRLKRLKIRTKSLFFEQDSSNNELTKTPQRPKLNKAYSDIRQNTIETTSAEEFNHQIHPQHKTILRRRSKTFGSVENDLHNKINGSIVKTIGSMVMLKPRQNTADSIPSSENSDTGLGLPPLPELDDNDTPESYLKKLTDEGFGTEISSILATKDSQLMADCFTLFLNKMFDFFDQPLDVSLRRFLFVCELPKETQQIDRALSGFSTRYYECNPDLWDNSDQVYFLTFSFVMLQTDHFNPNNKKKMTKEEFVKNTKIDDKELITNNRILSKEVLECFYDNITYNKFIHKNKLSQPIYSLSKRLFPSTSSTNLEAIDTLLYQTTNNSQNRVYSSNTRSYSISSSTSQFFGIPQIDPYALIMTDQINSLKLSLNPVKGKNPFSKKLRNAFPDSYFDKLRKRLRSTNSVYIRFSKACNWLTSKTEIYFKEGEVAVDNETRCLIKVIKIAELNKEEYVKNVKFFQIGAATIHAVWKKCYGVLTTCGFFIFDNLNFLAVSERERLLSDDYDEDEPLIIDILSDQILRNCSQLSINGLFACQADTEDSVISTFNIFSTNKKELFSTNTFLEMSSWIIAINFIAALDSCYIEFQNYHSHEVFSIRNVSIEDKIIRLSKNATLSAMKIDDLIRLQHHLRILTPFQQKTKETIFSHYHSIEVRLDWLWYELERNQVYVDILQRELKDRDSFKILPIKKKITESLLEDSFFSQDTQIENSVALDDDSNVEYISAFEFQLI